MPGTSNGNRASGGNSVTRSDLTTLMNNRDKTFTEAMEQLRQDICTDYTSKVSDIINSLEFTQRELADTKDSFERIKAENAQLQNQLENVSQELMTLKQQFNKAELRADYMEDQSRRNNLRISGVPEEPNENWEQTQQKVARLFHDKFNVTPDLERAHRVGKNKTKTRDIVAKFFRFQDRDAVYMDRRKLKGTQIYINDDLCPATVEVRRQQKGALLEARQQGKVAYFNYRTLVVKEPTQTERGLRHARHGTAQPAVPQASPPTQAMGFQISPRTSSTRPLAVYPLNEAAWPAPTNPTSAASPTTQTISTTPVHISPVTDTAVGTNDANPTSPDGHSVTPADDTSMLVGDGVANNDPGSPVGRGARSKKQPSYYMA